MPDTVAADRPAVLGGKPVRNKPFSSRPMIGEVEVSAVAQTIRDGLFSRFVGSPIPGTREQLRQTSEELRDLEGSVSFLGGPNVRRFEADWAKAHDVPYAITVNSATSGITTALMAMNIGPGCEVITTPLSFTATATAIVAAQAVPVFADIDGDTLCLDPAAVERAITPATKCILPVHWCGNAGDFDAIMEIARRRGIAVLEDSAQAPGSTYRGRFLGNHGDAGVFSFSEPKNVMTGEGGMIVTSNADIAEKCRLIRNHGESIPMESDADSYVVNVVGFNFRMTEATAALGWVQTGKLAEVNRLRNRNYKYLIEQLKTLPGDNLVPQRVTHPDSYHAYTALFRWREGDSGITRDMAAQVLRSEGIPVATGVGRLMSDNLMFKRKLAFGYSGYPFNQLAGGGSVSYDPGQWPVAHRVHDIEYLGFFLLGWPNIESDMDDIVAAFRKLYDFRKELGAHFRAQPVVAGGFERGRGN